MYDHFIFDLESELELKSLSCDEIEELSSRFLNQLKLTEVSKVYNQFRPYGVTGVHILSESHYVVHTWPERNTIYIDLFICIKIDEIQLYKSIGELFKAKIKNKEIIRRK